MEGEMTRKSKRELERAVEQLGPQTDYDGPEEIVIRDEVVGTDWDRGDLKPNERRGSVKRIYREDGEWHSGEFDTGDIGGDSDR